MAIMFLNLRDVARGRGGSAVAKAAYITRDRLLDERAGIARDYRHIGGLEHAEVLLPASVPAATAEWARDRQTLWNRAEIAEPRRNSRVALEYTVSLPHELPHPARLALAKQFAQGLANRYGTAVDLAVHAPPPHGDPRNHHAHILATTRELTADGFGRKASIHLSHEQRRALGLPHISEEFRTLRRQWAELANERLREAQLDARLEPRSRRTLAREQAMLERERAAAAIARPGLRLPALVPVATPAAAQARALPQTIERATDLDAAQQRAAEAWLESRQRQGQVPAAKAERAHERGADAGLEL